MWASHVASGLRSAAERSGVAAAIRLPRPAGHVAYLDGWRGICILLVLAGHLIKPLRPLATVGVEMFFVLSGRLMAEILILKGQSLSLFLKRRISRIVPALLVFVGTVAVISNLAWWFKGEPTNWTSPIAALLFFHNYLLEASTMAAFEHTWSLAVEEHSYLALGLIGVATRRNRLFAALIAIAVAALAIVNGVILWSIPQPGSQAVLFRSDVRIASVLMSFSLCLLFQPMLQRKPGPVLASASPLCALVAIICIAAGDRSNPLQVAAAGLLAATAINTVELSADLFRRVLSTAVLVWAGALSYSLYLWQQLFFSAAPEPWAPLLAIPALALAVWSYKRVECPARAFLNSRWTASQTPAPRELDQRLQPVS